MSEAKGITEATLRELLDSGAVRAIHIVGQAEGWAVEAELGTHRRVLRSARSPVRWWKSMDRLTRWLRGDLGIAEWTVDAENYEPARRMVPNATTAKALAELNTGKGKRFATADGLFQDLGV